MHPLDNAVWRALTGVQSSLAQRRGDAARYQPGVTVFAALPDDPTPDDWRDLAGLVAGDPAVVFRPGLEVPAGWIVDRTLGCFQLWAPDPTGRPPALAVRDVSPLGSDDVDDMLALVEVARPGPFGRRTVELGSYLGVRVAGRLVAMAGERMRFDGHTEISAVATHPRHRGEGLASALVVRLLEGIEARGDVPFLHVAEENVGALRLYEHLGFTIRADTPVHILRAPAEPV